MTTKSIPKWPFRGIEEPERSRLTFTRWDLWPKFYLMLKSTRLEPSGLPVQFAVLFKNGGESLQLVTLPEHKTLVEVDIRVLPSKEVSPDQLIAEGWLVD